MYVYILNEYLSKYVLKKLIQALYKAFRNIEPKVLQ